MEGEPHACLPTLKDVKLKKGRKKKRQPHSCTHILWAYFIEKGMKGRKKT